MPDFLNLTFAKGGSEQDFEKVLIIDKIFRQLNGNKKQA